MKYSKSYLGVNINLTQILHFYIKIRGHEGFKNATIKKIIAKFQKNINSRSILKKFRMTKKFHKL